MKGPNYEFDHGIGIPVHLLDNPSHTYTVPTGYNSMTATLKAANATVRLYVDVGGANYFDENISALQPAKTITCPIISGATLIIGATYVGNATSNDAAGIFGDARISASQAPTKGYCVSQ